MEQIINSVFLITYNCAWKPGFLKSSHIYTYYHFTHHKILVMMVLINEMREESCLLHDRPKCFILSNFHSFNVISITSGHKKVHNFAVVHPIGALLGFIMLLT